MNSITFEFPNDGQQTPAPAHYVGGIHDMPEGSTAYIKMQLEEGEYGIVAEVPDAKEIDTATGQGVSPASAGPELVG